MLNRALRVLPVAALATLLITTIATPAHAAGGVEVSTDGVTFASTIPSALYSLADPLVPASSVSEDFFVRNSATAPAVLRITLIDAHANDVALANALTVTATLAGTATGTPVVLSAAEPCAALLDGPIMQPGDVYNVETTLALGDLSGQDGQGATAQMSLRVTLLDTAYPELAPTDCGPDGADVPVIPGGSPAPQETPRSASPDSSTALHPAAAPQGQPTAAGPRDTDGDVQLPVLGLPALGLVDPNTGALNVFLILVILGAFIVGLLAFWLVAWRRRRKDDEQAVGESL